MGSSLGIVAVFVLVILTAFLLPLSLRWSRSERAAWNNWRLKAKALRSWLSTSFTSSTFTLRVASSASLLRLLALGWIGEPALAHLVEPPLEAVFGSVRTTLLSRHCTVISFTIITALHIVIGELAPKGVGPATNRERRVAHCSSDATVHSDLQSTDCCFECRW